MRLIDFIKDRLAYYIIYLSSTALVMLTMLLAGDIYVVSFNKGSAVYAFLLSFILLISFIAIDYTKNKSFYSYLHKLEQNMDNLESVLTDAGFSTHEQRLYKRILTKGYKHYKDSLSRYEENQRQYTVFMNQWIHQMKTPVSVINLLLQDLGSDKKELRDSITEENDKIARGLEIMLFNARLSQFNLDFLVESQELSMIIREVINSHKKYFIRYSIYPKLTGDMEVLVESDKKWIAFVINQIIINSIKYSKDIVKENKQLLIDIKKETDQVRLSIQDEGIGIPKEDIGRVFNAFFTGKNGRKTSESTGMGLYLSKRICDELGHGLYIEAEEGMGTKLTLVFKKGKNLYKL